MSWIGAPVLVLTLSLQGAAQPSASSQRAREALSAAGGAMLQGDAARALAELARIPADEYRASDRTYRDCMLARFRPNADGSFPIELERFVRSTLGVYRAYWRAALADPEGRMEEEERLRRNLNRLLGLSAEATMEEAEQRLRERLEGDGYHLLMGRTPPFRELMIWRSERAERREVILPEGSYSVEVRLLEDFFSLGWANYATCGRSVSGGWVGSDAIYAVVPGWPDLTGEQFLVSFVAHEAQHFWDRERFPGISHWELEYRAKLAELASARTTIGRLLGAFRSNQGDEPRVPHSYANRKVLQELRLNLNVPPDIDLIASPVETINAAARRLLLADSQRRFAGGRQ